MKKSGLFVSLGIYLLVNSLFIIKYGEGKGIVLLGGYFFALFCIGFFFVKINLKELVYKFSFFFGVAAFFILSIFLNYKVDGNSLNVDRWSAMEVGIKAIMNGDYPYNIVDHMGRESSNLPVLVLIGLPFYLIFGSVGYLQSFVFLLFCFIFFKVFKGYKLRLLALILLCCSPCYLWEVYVKSDLFSNFVIVVAFLYIIWNYFLVKPKLSVIQVSILTTLLLLTRIASVIPIILILLKRLWQISFSEKVRFFLVSCLTVLFLLFIFLHNAHNFNEIIQHNPLLIQGTKQPLLLSFSYIVLSVVLAFKVKDLYEIIFWSGTLLFVSVLISFLIKVVQYGYLEIFVNSGFDISFFNISIPFMIMSVVLGVTQLNKQRNL